MKKFLAWYDGIQFRVEEINDGDWLGSVRDGPLWEPFRAVSEGGAKHGAKATIQNRYPLRRLDTLEWRELSDMSNVEWDRGFDSADLEALRRSALRLKD